MEVYIAYKPPFDPAAGNRTSIPLIRLAAWIYHVRSVGRMKILWRVAGH